MKTKQRFSGQSLLEFSIILPTALLLITGFLDIGRAIFYYSSLTNAVREATRYAIVHKDEITTAYDNPSDNSLQDKVLEYAFGLTGTPNALGKDEISVIVEKEDNKFITVSIEAIYNFSAITPGINIALGSSDGIDLNVQSKMYVTPGAK